MNFPFCPDRQNAVHFYTAQAAVNTTRTVVQAVAK